MVKTVNSLMRIVLTEMTGSVQAVVAAVVVLLEQAEDYFPLRVVSA